MFLRGRPLLSGTRCVVAISIDCDEVAMAASIGP